MEVYVVDFGGVHYYRSNHWEDVLSAKKQVFHTLKSAREFVLAQVDDLDDGDWKWTDLRGNWYYSFTSDEDTQPSKSWVIIKTEVAPIWRI